VNSTPKWNFRSVMTTWLIEQSVHFREELLKPDSKQLIERNE
jgi:hypothetical protein